MFKRCTLLSIMLFCACVRSESVCQRSYYPCADKLCCCKKTIAICEDRGTKLPFIPKLPDKIQELKFRNNFLPTVNSTTFENITGLCIRTLRLDNNQIMNISKQAFVGLGSLREISFDGNTKLNTSQLALAFGSIQTSDKLTISLTNTSLTEIQSVLFQHLTHKNVTKIFLDDNQLTSLNFKHFEYLGDLQSLSVKTNRIRYISLENGHRSLETLNLAENEIARYVPKFCNSNHSILLFPNLSHLDLSSNFISELNGESWNCLNRLEYLSLASNVVRIVPKNVFASLNNLQRLNFQSMNGNLQTIESYAFSNNRLKFLNVQENIFDPSFVDIFQGCQSLKTVLISNSNLKEFSEIQLVKLFSPLKNLEYLKAERCKINHFPRGILQILKNLHTVLLDQNHIETLEEAFTTSSSLSYLSLQSNRIRVLDKKTFPTNMPSNLTKLNLAQNPFECTCDMLWFRTLIGDRGKVGHVQLANWPDRYNCATPPNMKLKRLIDYHPTESACKNIVLIALLCVASLLLLVSVVSVISYRYRWNIALWLYKIKPRKRNTETEPLLDGPMEDFRGYVIYDLKDRQFVHDNLRLLVEEQMNYKLKISGRDGGYGGAELEEMADSIYFSEHVVAVLSKASLANEWVRFQIDVALYRQMEMKKNILMLLLLDDIDFKSLSKHWCVLFTRLPTARWCEDETNIRRRVFEQQLAEHLMVEYNHTV